MINLVNKDKHSDADTDNYDHADSDDQRERN